MQVASFKSRTEGLSQVRQPVVRFAADPPASPPPPAPSDELSTPTLLQLLARDLKKLKETEPEAAKVLNEQKEKFFSSFGDYASVLMVFIQFRISIDKVKIPGVPQFIKNTVSPIVVNQALKEFQRVGFEEKKLRDVLTKFDEMDGNTAFKELIVFCDKLAKQNFRDFLAVPTFT